MKVGELYKFNDRNNSIVRITSVSKTRNITKIEYKYVKSSETFMIDKIFEHDRSSLHSLSKLSKLEEMLLC